MAYSGRFKPTNVDKYKGDITTIVWRSLLELRMMKHLDTHPSVLEWSSEETIIPYYSPIDSISTRKLRRYFVDFKVTRKTKSGDVKTCLIEVKPFIQCKPPTKPKRLTVKAKNRYLRESVTYSVNQAKWESARKVCDSQGWEFLVITEKDLKF